MVSKTTRYQGDVCTERRDPSMREAEWLDEGYRVWTVRAQLRRTTSTRFMTSPPGGRSFARGYEEGRLDGEHLAAQALSCWSALDADGCCALRAQA